MLFRAVEDLIYEESLGIPVLQVLCGRFIPGADDQIALAILHPRKLSIFELVRTSSYHTLTKLYEHHFGEHFTASNMTSGCFGGVGKSREMIVIQSMDGKLQFYEQTAHAFTRQFHDCLLPGPILYLPKTDCFVTSTYAARMECYRYHVIAAAASSNNREGESKSREAEREREEEESKLFGASESKEEKSKKSGGVVSLKNALNEWTINIGEQARQVVDGHFSPTQSSPANSAFGNRMEKGRDELLVLCDHNIYLIKVSVVAWRCCSAHGDDDVSALLFRIPEVSFSSDDLSSPALAWWSSLTIKEVAISCLPVEMAQCKCTVTSYCRGPRRC